MRILVTNDDGIQAHGLSVLRQMAGELSDDVWVVAPQANQSGISHALTLHEPIRYERLDERTYAIRGTPADCVIMAVRHILKDGPPTLVLSGVNHGANVAEDVMYSGTIAGAMEANLIGIRSIAMSLAVGAGEDRELCWETPLSHGPALVERLLSLDPAQDVLFNVNFPGVPPDEVAGIMATSQARRDQNLLDVDERHDTNGRAYFWYGFTRRLGAPAEGSDLWAIAKGLISVTPLHANLTHPESLSRLADGFDQPVALRRRRLG